MTAARYLRNGIALIIRSVQDAVVGHKLRNDRMILLHFQGKPFSITVIQVYVPTTNAEEAEAKWFYEDLQDLLESLVGLHRTVQLSFFGISGWDIDLDYCDVEWFALKINQDHSVVFVIVQMNYI